MKSIWKSLLGITLAALLISIPAQASAASVYVDAPKTQVLTLYPSKDKAMNSQSLGYVQGKVSGLKSSKPSVVSVSKMVSGGGTFVIATTKKVGKATVSFKVKSKTYKIKVTVKKYSNPVSSIKIGNTTVSGKKFKNSCRYSLKYSKFANKKVKVTIKLAKGWKFEDYVTVKGKGSIGGFFYSQRGWKKSSGIQKNGSKIPIKGGKGYQIIFYVIHKVTGQKFYMVVDFK